MKRQISVIFTLMLTLFACGQEYKSFDEMAVEMARGKVEKLEATTLNETNVVDAVYLDAREKEEFDVSHIKGAIYVGYDDFDISDLPDIKDKTTIIVYCSVGYRSEKIAEELIKNGYSQTKNLYGGIFDWVNKGYPVYDNSNQETKKVHAYNESWGKWLLKGDKVYE